MTVNWRSLVRMALRHPRVAYRILRWRWRMRHVRKTCRKLTHLL